MKTIISRTVAGLLLVIGIPLLIMVAEQLVTGEFASSFYGQLTSVGFILFALLILKKLSSNTKQTSKE
jgi:hypothetical protein